MRHLRIFVSSPGDTDHERRRVDRVVERLNGEFAGTVRIDTIRWETEFYRAHATFQAQIPEAAECEIVIAIFRHRIGSQLPTDFARLSSDRAYPSGSAYEVLSAIEACRVKGFPDVYVFRHPDPPMVRLDDPQAEQVHEQWRRLKEFFDEWFFDGDGPFKAAFQHFASVDDFEVQVDRLLRAWLEEKVLHGRAVAWPIATKGSPFRGLAAFGAKHAPVFFGRSREIARAIDAWKDAAARGTPFLLVLGASGAGKSSLAHAGLLPRLTAPGVVPDVDVWRVAAIRPLEMPGGPLEAVAARLLDAEADLPDDERGRPQALPELADSDYRTPHQLAQLFAHPTAAATAPIRSALDRIGRAARAQHGYERDLRADLVLLVDQLDELFAADLPAEQREAFVRLLQLLGETGRVWIVATLRADLYDKFLAEPVLLQLKTGGAACDLAPPGTAQLAEIVRQPADAAELQFETDPATGEQLDERLLREADRPDMLPLVQLALNRLFDERAEKGGVAMLTFAAYDRLGGLAGIIDHIAEAALAGLDQPAVARLPQLLRRLAAVTHSSAIDARSRPTGLSVRTMPLDEAGGDAASRRLIERLVDARILLTSGDGAAIGVRLAHERVLTDWRRARELVAANGEFYRVRDEVEEQRRRWESAGKSRDLLIPSGLPLAEAEAIDARFGGELERDAHDFIAASGRRARRRQRLATAAAGVFALLAIAATGAGIVAREQQQRAEHTLDAAKQAIDVIVIDVANGLRNIEGVRTATIRTVLQRIEKSVDWLTSDAPNDLAMARLNLVMMDEFARTYMTAGDLDRARQAAETALSKGKALAQRYPDDPEWRRIQSVALNKLGALSLGTGEATAAARSFQQARDIMQSLLKSKPDNSQWQRDLSSSLSGIGDVKAAQGDVEGALGEYERSLAIVRDLAHRDRHDAGLQRDHAVRLLYCGDMRHRLGQRDLAIADYESGLQIMRKLVASSGDNAQWQRDLFVNLTRLGDVRLEARDQAGALKLYQEALSLARRLADLDPSNPQLLWYIASSQGKLGDAELGAGDLSATAAAYESELTIMRQLAKRDPSNAAWQRDLAVSLNKIADLKLLTGNAESALPLYQEGLSIVTKLTGREHNHAVWLRDMAISHTKIGDLKLRTGDSKSAAADYEEALAILRRLAERAPADAQVQRDLSVTLNKLGDAWMRSGDGAKAVAQYTAALATVRRLSAADPGNLQYQWDLNYTLNEIGKAKLALEDKAGALAAYREALDVVQRLAKLNPGNVERQTDLVAGLYRVASASLGDERENFLRDALTILGKLQSGHQLADGQRQWLTLIRGMLERPQ